MIALSTPRSKSVSQVMYDEKSSKLIIDFRDNPYLYVYHGVPRSVFDQLVHVEQIGGSVGQFRRKYINSKIYKREKILK